MSRFARCPLACPVVSSTSSQCPHYGAASARTVPANVLPPHAGGRHVCCLQRPQVVNGCTPQGETLDPAVSTTRPPAGPLARTLTLVYPNSLVATARTVPAKEEKKRQARGTPFQRGKP